MLQLYVLDDQFGVTFVASRNKKIRIDDAVSQVCFHKLHHVSMIGNVDQAVALG
ncbi:hypothetical protein D3C86_1296580 [compost metagenome]